jgi:hypothetical protein
LFTSALRSVNTSTSTINLDKDYREIYQSEKRKNDDAQDLESRCFQKFADNSGYQINVFYETKLSVFVPKKSDEIEIKSEIINFQKKMKNENGNKEKQKQKWIWTLIRGVKKYVQTETRMFEMIEMQKSYESFFFILINFGKIENEDMINFIKNNKINLPTVFRNRNNKSFNDFMNAFIKHFGINIYIEDSIHSNSKAFTNKNNVKRINLFYESTSDYLCFSNIESTEIFSEVSFFNY